MKISARSLCFVAALVAVQAPAQSLPPSDQVLARLRLVNNHFLQTWPDPTKDIVTDRARPSNIWTRAVYFEGLMALYRVDADPRYTDYAIRWGESHSWGLAYGVATDRVADDQCCGQTYLDLYQIDPRPERIRDITTAIDAMVNSTKSDDWWWIDALQMAMPTFIRLGVLKNDPRYFDKAYSLYTNTRNVQGAAGLYNSVEHLWWRDGDFDPPYAEPNGASCYWSRGNGWVFAALVRVVDQLPANESHRAEYLRTFQDMAAALVPLQRADGFWNVSLMDPNNYGGRELSGTAMLTYGMAWGIAKGYLPRATYLPVVAKAWSGLSNLAVHPDGVLGYAQGSGKQPSDGQPVTYDSLPNFDDFGTGAFLLAGSEVLKLATAPAVDYIDLAKTSATIATSNNALSAASVYGRVRIGGTGLATAFQSPPRLLFPDQVTSAPLTYDPVSGEWTYTLTASPTAHPTADEVFPTGNYTLVVGDTTIRDVALSAAIPTAVPLKSSGWASLNSAAAITFASDPCAARAPAGSDILLHVQIASGPAVIENSSLVAPGSNAISLALPPYALAPGVCAASMETSVRTFYRTNVDLGKLGAQAAITARMSSRTDYQGLAVAEPTHSRERLVNLSARGTVTATSELIAGFTISDGAPKTVLVRAAGPALQKFGVSGAASNPTLRVYNATRTRLWLDDDWQGSPQYAALDNRGTTTLLASYTNVTTADAAAAQVGAFPFSARSRDAALVIVLPPGAYTAIASNASGGTAGTALLECYELDAPQLPARFTNLSARGSVAAGGERLTLGFVVTGGPKSVLVRAIGPTLTSFGFSAASALSDPTLVVSNSSGQTVGQNDNWGATADVAGLIAFRQRVGAFALPASSKDAELVITLPPGAYTAQVTGADGGGGIALAEIYTEPPGL